MTELPYGTVTFLFTDVESSTQLLRALGDKFPRVLREHQAILRETFAAHGGAVIDSSGDSFFVAFTDAVDAVGAAANAQRALENRAWPAGADFRVRMGIDSGQATPESGRYPRSIEVNRGSRICGVAHGGQVLLSQATADLVRDGLSDNLGLLSLGEYALRDFPSEYLYQLVLDDHPRLFPPLRAIGLQTADSPAPRAGETLRFVNRSEEIKLLRTRLTSARAGRGGVVLLSGEPGVGKTRLVEELDAEATSRGFEVVWGRCWESEGAPGFWPWMQILRQLAQSRAPLVLRAQLGVGASMVAELVPELKDRLPELQNPPDSPSFEPVERNEEARFQLFDAIANFLRNVSRAQPLLLVLDDLHWSAKESLLLIKFLMQQLNNAHLLIVGTRRDISLDRRRPLAEFLPSFRRERAFERLALEGLEDEAIGELVTSFFEQPLDARGWALARALRDETNGNPFFVQEELRYLIENERIVWREGLWTSDARSISDLGLPEAVRDVVDQRLAHLPKSSTDLLIRAAVIGRVFDALTLQILTGADEDALDAALDDAESAGIIEQAPERFGRYRFFHALYREELYRQLPPRRRARLHQQIATALEQQYATRIDSHLSELAYHYVRGRRAGSAEKAISYARRAGEQALATYAYEEAVGHFEAALSVIENEDPPDQLLRCDLLLALAGALLPSGEAPRAADRVAPAAFEIAESIGDRQRAFRACKAAIEALLRTGISRAMATSQYRSWLDRAAQCAEPESNDQLWVDIRLQFAEGSLGFPGRTWEGRVQSLERAVGSGDEGLLCLALNSMLASGSPGQFASQVRVAEEYAGYQWRTVPITQRSSFAVYCASKLLDAGDRKGWKSQREQILLLASRTRDPYASFWMSYLEHEQLQLDGKLEEDLALQKRLLNETRTGGMQLAGLTLAARSGSRVRLLLGRAPESLTLLAQYCNAAGLPDDPRAPGAVLCRAYLGHREQVWKDLDWLMTSALDLENQDVYALVQYLEAAVLTEHQVAARELSNALAPAADAAICRLAYTSAARHLAGAARLLGDPVLAREYAAHGLAVSSKIENRPEIALSHLQLAEVMLEPPISAGEPPLDEALAHLASAANDLRKMNMQSSLERAEALQAGLPEGLFQQRRH